MFHFSAESLAKLKAKANAESGTTKISSFQSLSAILWRSITRAHCQPPNQGTSCRHGLQGSICNYKSALVVIVPGNGGNWWTSEGKRGGNSLIHSSVSEAVVYIQDVGRALFQAHVEIALWVIQLQRHYGNLMHTITVGLSHSLTHLFLEC
ncbi:hypothetical protein ACFX2C_004619 [Malus domestica]